MYNGGVIMKEVFRMLKTIFVLNKKETSVLARKTYGERTMTSKPKEHSLLCARSYGKEVNANGGENLVHSKKVSFKNK